MVNDQEIKNLYVEKTKRMLAFLGFQSIGDLSIDVYLLKFNSAKITVDKKNRVRVLAIEVFCYPDQETQWYIDIPVMVMDNKHTMNTCGHIENSLLHTYIEKQTKYLRLFDRLHKNALYLHEKVEVNMNIIDTHDEKIPENEFDPIYSTTVDNYMKAVIAEDLYGSRAFYQVWLPEDEMIKRIFELEKKQIKLLINKRVDGIIISLSNGTGDFFHLNEIHSAIQIENSLPVFINEKLNNCLLDSQPEKITILTDGVPSFQTKAVDLSFLNEISNHKEITLVVDESHSLGIIGKNGSGIYSSIDFPIKRKILVSSLGKAFGLTGGVIASDSEFIQQIKEIETF